MAFIAPFRSPFSNPFPKEGGAAAATYAEILRDTYGASEIWPLVNISSGTTISAFINSARNGTLTGWDLQNTAGPVTGTLAPYIDGTNDAGNILSASLTSIWSATEGGMLIWGNVSAWSGAFRTALSFYDGSSRAQIQKHNDNLIMRFYAGSDFGQGALPTTGAWHSYGIRWSNSENLIAYTIDGVQQDTDIGLSLPSTIDLAGIGEIGNGTLIWAGWLAYAAIWAGSAPSVADFLAMHNAAATAGADT